MAECRNKIGIEESFVARKRKKKNRKLLRVDCRLSYGVAQTQKAPQTSSMNVTRFVFLFFLSSSEEGDVNYPAALCKGSEFELLQAATMATAAADDDDSYNCAKITL